MIFAQRDLSRSAKALSDIGIQREVGMPQRSGSLWETAKHSPKIVSLYHFSLLRDGYASMRGITAMSKRARKGRSVSSSLMISLRDSPMSRQFFVFFKKVKFLANLRCHERVK